jgi:hypothetical protein
LSPIGGLPIRHPAIIRLELLAGVEHMLERVRIRLSMYASDELEVLRKLEKPTQYDSTVAVTNFLMERLGHVTAPKEPRFDKTRRALAKRKLRGPRGVKTAGPPQPSDAMQQEVK